MPKQYQPVGVGMKQCTTKLGRFIRAHRLALGLRQRELAQKAGIAQAHISMLEVGALKSLSPGQVPRLAKALLCKQRELRALFPQRVVAKPTTKLGKLIRSRRKKLGMTLGDLAVKLGVRHRSARVLELKKNPSLKYPQAKLLAEVLKLDVAVFAKFVGKERTKAGNKLAMLIRKRRQELAISQTELADKLNYCPQFIQQIESGRCSLCESFGVIKKLARTLKLDVGQMKALTPAKKQRLRGKNSPP